ncbi:enoyl-CoA hydratase-related protein [Veronia pacifica]|uniref:Enoyl-CoA hydratase n=1 Tax=Veronia pacifica TaxID=1080227 RepID=A0A1C3EES0_9GAMM|nr:enoyl-CoA hydratase-related protein [Veronia pacifica]ODA31736.1 enoyl-CoA hydratase [Veronia pacifica]
MTVLLERNERVAIVTLNRPEKNNALNRSLTRTLIDRVKMLDSDQSVGCIVLAGAGNHFCCGADITEMKQMNYVDMVTEDYFSAWDDFVRVRTPIIAAIHGLALGGGCELAMMCDIVFADKSARFGQPEIRLGVIPAIGGTQRLTKLVGKAKAMDMVLTGDTVCADEAKQLGLISRVFDDNLMERTMKKAHHIASLSQHAVQLAKECVKQANNLSINDGLVYERRVFHGLFATNDQTEGMSAFIEKRSALFTNT